MRGPVRRALGRRGWRPATCSSTRHLRRVLRRCHRHAAAENIAYGTGSLTAYRVVQMWMHSPGHRHNLLNPRYTVLGVGTWRSAAPAGSTSPRTSPAERSSQRAQDVMTVRGSLRRWWRPWQDSNLRSRLRRAVLYPLSYRGLMAGDRGYRSGATSYGIVARHVRRYACAVTPEQLSALVVAALTSLVERGDAHAARRRPGRGHGRAAAQQGARRLRHQRRAAAGQEGRPGQPAGARAAARRRAAPPTTGIATVDIAGPGFLNIPVAAGAQGEVAAEIVAAGTSYGTARPRSPARRSTSSSSPPTRPARSTSAASRWAAVGDSLGRIFDDDRRRGHPRVLLQRPRRPDRPVRPLAAGQRAGRAGARGRLRRRVHRRDRRAVLAKRPDALVAARRRGAGGLPRRGRRPDVRRDQGEPARLRRRLRRLLPREQPARVAVPSSARSSGCASSATSTSRTARSGCAPRSTATTRTGSSSSPTASRPTSPATWPTTSTSASAASTAASSCSAPTTTATSAG